MRIYKEKDRTIWRFRFKWTDDENSNKGYQEIQGYYTGTKKDFEEWRKDQESGFGFGCWDIKKRHATVTEWIDYCFWKT